MPLQDLTEEARKALENLAKSEDLSLYLKEREGDYRNPAPKELLVFYILDTLVVAPADENSLNWRWGGLLGRGRGLLGPPFLLRYEPDYFF